MKTVKAILATNGGRQPALLSADLESNGDLATLIVGGVAYAPEDLPQGAYLLVEESEMADRATMAGFSVGPPHTRKRRAYTILGKFLGAVLLGGAVLALYWALQRALALNLLGALVAVGLSMFFGLLGLFWWSYGGEQMLQEDAANRSKARNIRRRFGSFFRRP